MKLLRNEVSFGHEVKFALMCEAYFILRSRTSLAEGKFH